LSDATNQRYSRIGKHRGAKLAGMKLKGEAESRVDWFVEKLAEIGVPGASMWVDTKEGDEIKLSALCLSVEDRS
jgi:hypothetical protein